MKHIKYFVLAATVVLAACEEEIVETPVYQALPLSTRSIGVSASAAGVVEPVQLIEVKSKASGEITQVRVETGDVVTPGQLLVRVDPRVPTNAMVQAEADLEVANAQVNNAQAQLRRSTELFESQSITEQEHENALLQAANANAQKVRAERSLQDARIAFEDTEVRSPIAGIIIDRSVEVGSVIQSATSNVGGGAVLMTMANLDTVQIRALVDETDIGKIEPGLPVTITVDAYPNRPFRGQVLKIEPQATTLQNVTMFPVLVRIPNPGTLLKPGMNGEVDVNIGQRNEVLAVPYAALRTQRDVSSAAGVLGLSMETVQAQLAGESDEPEATNGTAEDDNMLRLPDGRQIEAPEGIDVEAARGALQKISNRDFQSMSTAERGAFDVLRSSGVLGGGGGGRAGRSGGGNRGGQQSTQPELGGDFIVFILRDGQPRAVNVKTGLTDLDYAEVVSGLAPSDTVLILPSASLISSQQGFSERISRVTGGGGIPGTRSR